MPQLSIGGSTVSEMLEVFLVSMLPIVELRGSIPLALFSYDLPWPTALILGVVGSLIPAIGIVLCLNKILEHLEGTRWEKLIQTFVKRRSKVVRKWGLVGLVVLVAIPLPLTGAWTGSLVASGLRLPVGRSLVCIFAGLVIAGGIVTTLYLLGDKIL